MPHLQQQQLSSPTSASIRSPHKQRQLEIVVPVSKQRFKELTTKWEATLDECVADNESCKSCDMADAAVEDVQAIMGSSKNLKELVMVTATMPEVA